MKLKSRLKNYQGLYTYGKYPCEVCHVSDKFPYWRTWTEFAGFGNGDDEINGNICDQCYQELKNPTWKKKLLTIKAL